MVKAVNGAARAAKQPPIGTRLDFLSFLKIYLAGGERQRGQRERELQAASTPSTESDMGLYLMTLRS